MAPSKANVFFKLFCEAKYDNKDKKSSLFFKLISNEEISCPFYLCFTCLAYLTNARSDGVQYQRTGSFFKFQLLENKKEWEFSIYNISYQFSSITDSPQSPFVDLNNTIIDNIELIFSSDYLPNSEETVSLENKEKEYRFPVVPQINYSTSIYGATIRNGFNIQSTNADKANIILRSTIKNFDPMIDEKGIQVICRLDESITGYKIESEKKKITITSEDNCHEFYAFLTLGQIWHFNRGKMPCFVVKDSAKYCWRGLLIDTVRRFYSIDELKKLIRFLSLLKFNKLQLHLSDDEGWRIESHRYPQLNQYGSYRGYTLRIKPQFLSASHKDYGGFYTKQEISELIDYAREFYIDILPEFSLLAHSHAILQSLPKLIEKNDRSDYISVQGYTQNTLNPGLVSTWEFIENIIHEYHSIFPFCYMHVGFDERPEGTWEESPACRELMTRKNLTTTNDVQTYFANKLTDILRHHNKKTAFWEEAAKGDIHDKSSLMFSWSSEDVTAKLIEKGYRVVASPAQSFYFDIREEKNFDSPGLHWVDSLNIDKVYLSKVIDHPNILGVQGALWGETLSSESSVYKMLFPRLFALSEVAWTRDGRKDLTQFKKHVDYLMEDRLSFYN